MKNVNMKKDVLIEKIRANMETHEATYEKARDIHREKQIARLESMLEDAKNGEPVDVFKLSRLPTPENHMEDYKAALEMLEDDTRDEIELSYSDYRQYVRDEWEWRRSWVANTASYLADAVE